MKKQILLNFVPIVAIGSPILIASSCDNTTEDNYFEKRAKETDEEIEKHYVNEYIQKENYIFDDFEQFKFDRKRHLDRPDIDPNVLDLYKDSNNNYLLIIDADWYLLIYKAKNFWPMLNKILELPNLNLNIGLSEFPIHKLVSSNLYQGRYLSKLNFVSDYMYYTSKEKNYAWTKEDYATLMSLASIPKPKLLPEIKDENNKYNDKPANILIKAGHADEFGDTSHTAWGHSAASYEQFYKTFLDHRDKKVKDLVEKYVFNVNPNKFHSSIVEIVKYKDQRIKETYTHYRFRAEKGNEDIKIFKWAGEVPKN